MIISYQLRTTVECLHNILVSTRQVQGPQARFVQSSWFKQHTWLTLCTSRQKLFCFPCVTGVHHNLLVVFSKNADSAFVSTGEKHQRVLEDAKQAKYTLKLYY